MKQYWCAANWKLHKSPQESGEFLDFLLQKVQDLKLSCQLVIYPQNFSCPIAAEKTKGKDVIWGAQNCYIKSFGAYTGENSPAILKTLGAKTVLLGHSERRVLFKEDDEMIAQKMQACTQTGLIPLLCVGESQEERHLKQTQNVLTKQLQGLKLVNGDFAIAYEPVWAIGSGKAATLEMIEEVHFFIKKLLSSVIGIEKNIPVLYGGSVKPENAKDLAVGKHIDGFLIGGASLEVESFLAIAKILEKSKKHSQSQALRD